MRESIIFSASNFKLPPSNLLLSRISDFRDDVFKPYRMDLNSAPPRELFDRSSTCVCYIGEERGGGGEDRGAGGRTRVVKKGKKGEEFVSSTRKREEN